ncbi:MAG: C40 family peptidase [Deltaproteobacteria bacterium]|nr:C40 family peptidase [Deltaproteobacteria bacterium]
MNIRARISSLGWALFLGLMVAGTQGCGTTVKSTPPTTPPSQHETNSPMGQKIAETAKGYLGTPYHYGGQAPGGFDCSGLVYYVYKRYGYKLPRSADDQIKVGQFISRKDLRPGDLVFFKVPWAKGYHVGLFAGNGWFIHAPRSGRRVEMQRIDEDYFRRTYTTARRIVDDV